MLFSLALIDMNTPREEKLGKDNKIHVCKTRFKSIINSLGTGFCCFPHKWIPKTAPQTYHDRYLALLQLWNKIGK